MSRKTYFILIIIGLTRFSIYAQNNYVYDQQGRLIADLSEEIAAITWNNHSKIISLTRMGSSKKSDLEFKYDALGNRILKLEKPRNGEGVQSEYTWKYTHYEYGEGKLSAIYEKHYEVVNENTFQEIFSRSEVVISDEVMRGMIDQSEGIVVRTFTADIGTDGRFTHVEDQGIVSSGIENMYNTLRDYRQYELSNFMMDVAVTVSDRKLANSSNQNLHYTAAVHSAMDYYPFGMTRPEMKYKNKSYRFGFGGMEKDNEIKDVENSYNFIGRSIYDPRIARFNSIDPLWRQFANTSPYAYAINNPISFIDKNGEFYEALLKIHAIMEKEKLDIFSLDLAVIKYLKTVDMSDYINHNSEFAYQQGFVYGALQGALDMGLMLADYEAWADGIIELVDLVVEIYKDPSLLPVVAKALKMNFDKKAIESMKKLMGAEGPGMKGFEEGQLAVDAGTFAITVLRAKKATTAIQAFKRAQCFVGDTEILTAGGKLIYIKDISTEKELHQWSEEELQQLESEEVEDYYQLEVEDIKFIVSYDQLFLVAGEWRKAEDLKEGDKVEKLDGTFVEVKRIVHISKALAMKALERKE